MMIKTVKVPESRIGVIIGKKGQVKKKIEKELEVKISLNEEVSIEGNDAIQIMDAENIIISIGRGFSPENALKLLDENNTLSIINLPSDKKKLQRIKSRIIGEEGKSRENIERLTETNISVFGKTVSVIGSHESVKNVTASIQMFIKGYSHRAIYAFLERQRAKRRVDG